jgi:tetratricopeptide (TPR) repeat protein
MVSQKSIRDRVMELSLGIKASTAGNRHFDLFPIIIFIVFLVGAVPATMRTFNVVVADYYHRLALNEASKNGTLTYQLLQKAETLNPQVDLYRVDMAQTNFALANALAAQKGPTQASAAGSLTDQDKQTIQTLLSQSINEGRVAVALSPRSSRNWEVLASIYRNITGVAKNALTFSLDAYGRAIQRDPLNPVLRLNVGGIYYAAKNYDLAIRFFTDAANLKPDYANAYYNLAIALRDKGDIQNAALVAQQLVAVLKTNPNSPDYKTAVKLFDDLKAKYEAAVKNAQQQQQQQPTNPEAQPSQAPAAQTNSALNNQNIGNVNVSNLNNPPQVTPAPSVKPNPNAKLPQLTPAAGAASPTPLP